MNTLTLMQSDSIPSLGRLLGQIYIYQTEDSSDVWRTGLSWFAGFRMKLLITNNVHLNQVKKGSLLLMAVEQNRSGCGSSLILQSSSLISSVTLRAD